MRTPLKRKAAVLAIGAHFFFIISVVTHLHDWMSKKPILGLFTAATDYYSAVTFTNRNFGFFAPGVTSDWNVQLTMVDGSGNARPYAFVLPNREMRVKMYSMSGHFAETDTSMDLFARAWALKAINENPGIVRVHVEITQNYIPTMEEYRQGRRIERQPFYRTTFDLR